MPSKDTERDAKLRESYTTALKQLRRAHQDEFNKLRVEAAKALGVEWAPPVTKEDKARQELRAIFAEHPELLAEVRQVAEPTAPSAEGS